MVTCFWVSGLGWWLQGCRFGCRCGGDGVSGFTRRRRRKKKNGEEEQEEEEDEKKLRERNREEVMPP